MFYYLVLRYHNFFQPFHLVENQVRNYQDSLHFFLLFFVCLYCIVFSCYCIYSYRVSVIQKERKS